MTHPTSRDIAVAVREAVNASGMKRATIAEVAGLSERQLRRRLHGETAFKAAELLAILQALEDNELLKSKDLQESLTQMIRDHGRWVT